MKIKHPVALALMMMSGCNEQVVHQDLHDSAIQQVEPSTTPHKGPIALTLIGPPLYAGAVTNFAVEGLSPSERVLLIVSRGGVGVGPCPVVMGGTCLDVRSPRRIIGRGRADASGRAEITAALDDRLDELTGLSLQAVAIRGIDGVDTVTSNAISEAIAVPPAWSLGGNYADTWGTEISITPTTISDSWNLLFHITGIDEGSR